MFDSDPLDADTFNHLGKVTAPSRAAGLRRQAVALASLYADLVTRGLLDSDQIQQDYNAISTAWQNATGTIDTGGPVAFWDTEPTQTRTADRPDDGQRRTNTAP